MLTNHENISWSEQSDSQFDDTLTLTSKHFDFSLAMKEQHCNPTVSTITLTDTSPTEDYGSFCFNYNEKEVGSLTFEPPKILSPACTDA